MVFVGRLGYRIVNRTIKRGSRVSNLIASSWRAQTFAFLAYHPSWLLFVSYSFEDFELVSISMTSSSSSKTDSICILYCIFDIGGFSNLVFMDRLNL